MSQLTLENILASAQVAAPHPARFVAVGEAAFHQFTAPLQQALAVFASHPPPVCVDRLLLLGVALPVPLALLPLLRNVTAHPVTLHPLENCAAQIALVRNQLFDAVEVDLRFAGTRLGPMHRQLGDCHPSLDP